MKFAMPGRFQLLTAAFALSSTRNGRVVACDTQLPTRLPTLCFPIAQLKFETARGTASSAVTHGSLRHFATLRLPSS